MIDFKALIEALHKAITSANINLMDQHTELIDKYFSETKTYEKDGTVKTTLIPKNVIIEYPYLSQINENGEAEVKTKEISVPLITLVPLTLSQIEKARVSLEFEMDVVDGELKVDFAPKKSGLFSRKSPDKKYGKIDITLSPHDTPEGVKLIVEGYERMLKNQMT